MRASAMEGTEMTKLRKGTIVTVHGRKFEVIRDDGATIIAKPVGGGRNQVIESREIDCRRVLNLDDADDRRTADMTPAVRRAMERFWAALDKLDPK
jgi:hypothetical protein